PLPLHDALPISLLKEPVRDTTSPTHGEYGRPDPQSYTASQVSQSCPKWRRSENSDRYGPGSGQRGARSAQTAADESGRSRCDRGRTDDRSLFLTYGIRPSGWIDPGSIRLYVGQPTRFEGWCVGY